MTIHVRFDLFGDALSVQSGVDDGFFTNVIDSRSHGVGGAPVSNLGVY